ncbi:MAG: CoB--CoM heterodisulfide reductase iron-sulfur subunit B family protein [Anaerolineae bacterium]
MRLLYFPGCTLYTEAKGFDNSVRASAEALGLELVEMARWNCCGATFPLNVDNMLDLVGPARNLIEARQESVEINADRCLVTACSTCYNVLKRTNHFLRTDEEGREKINAFVEAGYDYEGDLEVLDFLQVLRDEIGFERIAAAVKRPLDRLRVAAYYGCMVLRPPAEVAYDDPENPHALDDLMRALGAEPVDYPHKGECCGAYLAVKSPEVTAEMCHIILAAAQRGGAQALVTNCPLCQFNLDRQRGPSPVSVLYFTQLLAMALGLDDESFDLRPLLGEI